MSGNLDAETVEGFGDEWTRFDHAETDPTEMRAIFDTYFSLFPWEELPDDAEGVDLGVGSGRWAREVAPRVATLHCVDASADALSTAKRNLQSRSNVSFHHRSVGELPFADSSLDFAYSLGVLHHVPDTPAALREIARVLRPGAPFLVYLYYAFDNRPPWFQHVWRASDVLRQTVSRLPKQSRFVAAEILAALVYLPTARAAGWLERLGVDVSSIPLSAYRDRSYYVMRTDALDRFGTRLEQRFTQREIREMLHETGFADPVFRDGVPYWTALARKS